MYLRGGGLPKSYQIVFQKLSKPLQCNDRAKALHQDDVCGD